MSAGSENFHDYSSKPYLFHQKKNGGKIFKFRKDSLLRISVNFSILIFDMDYIIFVYKVADPGAMKKSFQKS